MTDAGGKHDVESLGTSHEKTVPEPMGTVTSEVVIGDDGFKLFPQPVTGDKLDPLNWSFVQKHAVLSIVMAL
jgi:hypothetical protein